MSFLKNIKDYPASNWKSYEKVGLRFFFLYFIIQTIPLDWKFYSYLFSINWFDVKFHELFYISRYMPQFFSLQGYTNWGVAILLAVIGAGIWSLIEKKNRNYDTILYWLRVILRYRLAIGIIAYGFIKLFPLQMPYPSLSNLHTNYGAFAAWKIYFHTLGITQGYESLLGAIEILAGILLFFRSTVTFGTGIIIGFTGNVLAANIAYNAGEQVYGFYLLTIAIFLFAYDVPRLYRLLALELHTQADKFQPSFAQNWLKNTRVTLKGAFVFLVLLYGFKTYASFNSDAYKIPQTPGISGTYGYYNVRQFIVNKDTIPYSTTDSNRWQNVVFEKWATVSIRIAKPLKIDTSYGDEFYETDIDRNYESTGVGDRRYFAYQADTVKQTLLLENKNKNHKQEKFVLSYKRLNNTTILLNGVNEKQDSIYAILDKINKKYMLYEGRRKPIKL